MKFLKENWVVVIVALAGIAFFVFSKDLNCNLGNSDNKLQTIIDDLTEENTTYLEESVAHSKYIESMEKENQTLKSQNSTLLTTLKNTPISKVGRFVVDTVYLVQTEFVDCPENESGFAEAVEEKIKQIETLADQLSQKDDRLFELIEQVNTKDEIITRLSKISEKEERHVFVESNQVLKAKYAIRGEFVLDPTYVLDYIIPINSGTDKEQREKLNYGGFGYQSILNNSMTQDDYYYKLSYGRMFGTKRNLMFQTDAGYSPNTSAVSGEVKVLVKF